MEQQGSQGVLGTRSGPPPITQGLAVLGAAEASAKPEEIEFLGSDYIVSIVPNVPIEAMKFIGGTFGPLRPGLATQVPLWLAINLKKREKCRIQPPPWLAIEHLEQCLKEEKEEDSYFCDLPFEFMEVWHELEANASDDIDRLERARVLIVDLLNERRKKLIVGLHSLDASTAAVNLNGLAHMELNMVRTHYVRAMNAFRALGGDDVHDAPYQYSYADTQTQTQTTATGHGRTQYQSTLHTTQTTQTTLDQDSDRVPLADDSMVEEDTHENGQDSLLFSMPEDAQPADSVDEGDGEGEGRKQEPKRLRRYHQ